MVGMHNKVAHLLLAKAASRLPISCDSLEPVILGANAKGRWVPWQACCTEAGMFALRERRVHVTQEDFEMAVAKVMKKDSEKNMSLKKLWK